jgi:hypothetical protein
MKKIKIPLLIILIIIVFSWKMSIEVPKVVKAYEKWQTAKAKVDSLKRLLNK